MWFVNFLVFLLGFFTIVIFIVDIFLPTILSNHFKYWWFLKSLKKTKKEEEITFKDVNESITKTNEIVNQADLDFDKSIKSIDKELKQKKEDAEVIKSKKQKLNDLKRSN